MGEPEHDAHSVDYLDMTIWFDTASKQWHSKLYDKKLAMVEKGLKLNKFPDPTSKLSSRCKYGVITSQLHRYNVACTTRSAFIAPARVLYRTYLEKGYITQRVNQYPLHAKICASLPAWQSPVGHTKTSGTIVSVPPSFTALTFCG